MTLVAVRPQFPQPQPGNPFPAPNPNPTQPRRQQVACPTCGGPVASLLAACWKPACLSADLDYDATLERRLDQ